MIDEGVYSDLSSEGYHADKDSISRSSLLDFSRSPFFYWANHINPNRPPKESTDAMEFGTAFHTLVLETTLFDNTYVMKPEPVFLNKSGREAYDKYKSVIEYLGDCGSTVLSAKDWETLMAMNVAISNNEDARGLIKDGVYEQSYFWKDKATGLMLKCRPDIQHQNMIVDLKTVASAEERVMQREVFDRGYDMQAAMMRDGIFETTGKRIDNFILLCVEKKYPYCIGIYILDEEVINRAETRYKDLLVELKKCQETNEWPSYPIATIGLPKWLI